MAKTTDALYTLAVSLMYNPTGIGSGTEKNFFYRDKTETQIRLMLSQLHQYGVEETFEKVTIFHAPHTIFRMAVTPPFPYKSHG